MHVIGTFLKKQAVNLKYEGKQVQGLVETLNKSGDIWKYILW